MPTAYGLTREVLDRMLVKIGEPKIGLVCTMHPTAGVHAFYQDGDLRLLCRECGFESVRLKVASAPMGEGS